MDWMMMPLRRYADFSGRSRRMEFWMWVLFQFILYTALSVVMFAVTGAAIWSASQTNDIAGAIGAGLGFMLFIMLFGLIWLVLLVPSLAVSVRRLHDINRSGWWVGGYFLASLGLNTLSFSLLAIAVTSLESAIAAGGVMTLLVMGLFVYALVLLVFFFLDGTPGANRYGPDPKGRADAANVFG
ncbi:MAG: DUF805 domain-containing protein [Sphingomonas sp.]|nr:DUF805 domain-containing protein [Sphingomonas sp.]